MARLSAILFKNKNTAHAGSKGLLYFSLLLRLLFEFCSFGFLLLDKFVVDALILRLRLDVLLVIQDLVFKLWNEFISSGREGGLCDVHQTLLPRQVHLLLLSS